MNVTAAARQSAERHQRSSGCEPPAKTSRLAFRIVMLALAVRLVLTVLSHGWVFTESRWTDYVSFRNEITNIAASIANGHGFSSPFAGVIYGDLHMGPSSWVAPVYPYFCAGIFCLFGVFTNRAYLFIVLAQCVISALTCVPIVKIGERTVGRRAGLAAAVLWAVFPWFSKWAVTWVWETSLSALLFTWLFWYALRLEDESASLKTWIGYGLLWGFAVLTNPALVTLLPLSLAWLILRNRPRLRVQPMLLSLSACLLVMSPWVARNRIVFGQWAFVRTNFGFEFSMGNFHGSHGRDWAGRHPTTNEQERAAYARLGELAYVREKAALGNQFVRAYPVEFAALTGKRALMFWDGSVMKYNMPIAPFWLPWSYLPLSLLFAVCLVWVCIRRVHGWALFLGAVAVYPAPYYIVLTHERYRHILEPLMLLVIVWAINDVALRIRRGIASS